MDVRPGVGHDSYMRSWLPGLALMLLATEGCATSSGAPHGKSQSASATRGASKEGWSGARPTEVAAPPNAVMLDYRSPEEIARARQAQPAGPQVAGPQSAGSQSPGPDGPVGPNGEPEEHPRIRQTIVIGKNNPDPVWEADGPGPAGYSDPAPQGPPVAAPSAMYYGRSYFYGGGGGGSSSGSAGGRSPKVGGDWPSAPSYGPKQMR